VKVDVIWNVLVSEVVLDMLGEELLLYWGDQWRGWV